VLPASHFLTHIALSWIVANAARLPARDRLIVVLAGTLPDLDGAGIVWSERAYQVAHRGAGHSLLFVLVVMAIAWLAGRAPWITAALAAASFHLHLLLDLVGTGGLPIRYFWPFSERGWTYSLWVLRSWPNAAVMAATALGVLLIAWWGRGPRAARPG
jgi:membrane-bound metal-dependent hydrolase YbcI (DUF457 family)